MDRIRKVLIATICVAAASGAPCSASVILVTNLGEPTRATTEIFSAGPSGPGLWAAQSFATDGFSYTLSRISTLLGDLSSNPFPPLVAELHLQGGPFNVGPLLTTLTATSLTPSPSLALLTPASAVTLTPNTTYWLVIGITGSDILGWNYAEGNDHSGPGSLGAYGYSNDNGVTWGSFDVENPYKIEVLVDPATVVPEPTSSTLLLFGLAGLVRWCRLRRRS